MIYGLGMTRTTLYIFSVSETILADVTVVDDHVVKLVFLEFVSGISTEFHQEVPP